MSQAADSLNFREPPADADGIWSRQHYVSVVGY